MELNQFYHILIYILLSQMFLSTAVVVFIVVVTTTASLYVYECVSMLIDTEIYTKMHPINAYEI